MDPKTATPFETPDALEEKAGTPEDIFRATLNILEDFNAEKAALEDAQRATLNILEDFEAEKAKVEAINQTLGVEIAKREHVEEALRRQVAMLDQSYDAIIAWEPNGPIVYWNQGAERLYSILSAEAVGRISHDLLHTVFPESLQHCKDALAGMGHWEGELNHQVRDGRRIVVESRMTLVREAGSTLVLETNRDITERKRAEEALQHLNTQLEAANKELEAFSYSVSHDLRAPLRGVDGWSLALLEDYGGQLDEKGQEYIHRVRSETQRMGLLIDDLLQLSRLTRAEMRKQRVDLSAIARSIAARLQETGPERPVEFVIQPGLSAEGDAHLLEVALSNLLDNAFKFTGKTPQARIEFGQTEIQGERAFFVRDNGAGFDMAFAKKLFGVFQRLHKPSEFPGTGIGLANVQRVIHRHGGRAWAEAEPGRGATFFFTLEGNL